MAKIKNISFKCFLQIGIAAFLPLLTWSQIEDWACEENFVSIGSSCYHFVGSESRMNATRAQAFCQSIDATLPDWTKNDTVNFLDLLIKSSFGRTPLIPIWVQSSDRGNRNSDECRVVSFPTDIARSKNFTCTKDAAVLCRKPACEAGTMPWGAVCYWMRTSPLSYVAAEEICRTEKQSPGRLAIVHNAGILEVLSRVVKAYQVTGSTWLGMNDRESEGVWRYSDGSLVRKEDVEKLWLKGEPNGGTLENCGVIFGRNWNFLLGDESCNWTHPALCEVDAEDLSVDFGPFTLQCQKGFRYFDGHCYSLVSEKERNFVESFDHCTSLGSTLSLARTDETIKFMAALANEIQRKNITMPDGSLMPPVRAWIGMIRDPSSYLNRGNLKTWLWSDGIYQAPDVLAAPNMVVKECPPNLNDNSRSSAVGTTNNKETTRKGCVSFVAASNFHCKLRSESCASSMRYFCQHTACKYGWIPFSINTCVVLVPSPKKYTNATKYCEALQSKIVFVTSNRDLQVLRQLFSKLLRTNKAINMRSASTWIQLVSENPLAKSDFCYIAKTDNANVTVQDCEETLPFFCQSPSLDQGRGKAQQLFESQMLSDGSYLPKDDEDDNVTPLIIPTLPTYNISRPTKPSSNGGVDSSTVATTSDDYDSGETDGDSNNVNNPTLPDGNKRTTRSRRRKTTLSPNDKPTSPNGNGGSGQTTNGGKPDGNGGKPDGNGGKPNGNGGKPDGNDGSDQTSNGGNPTRKPDGSSGSDPSSKTTSNPPRTNPDGSNAETTTLISETTRYRRPKKTTTIKTTTIKTTTPTTTTTLKPTTSPTTITTLSTTPIKTTSLTTQSSTIDLTTILNETTLETTTIIISTINETADGNATQTTTVSTTITTTPSTTITSTPSTTPSTTVPTTTTTPAIPTTIVTTPSTPRPTFKPIIPGNFDDTSYKTTSDIHIGDLVNNGTQVDDCCPALSGNGPLGFGDAADLNNRKRKKDGRACLQFPDVDRQKYVCLREPTQCENGLSMSIWIKISFDNDDTNRRYIISSGGDLEGTAGTALFHEGFYLHALVSTGEDTWHLVVPNTAPNNAWTNIGLRWHSKQGLHMFINGQPVGYVRFPLAKQSNGIVILPESESQLTVGCRRLENGSFDDFVSGDFDEFAMWTRFLPDQEIGFFMGSYDKSGACDPETNALRCETNTEDLLESVKNVNFNDLSLYNQSIGLLTNVSRSIAGKNLRGNYGQGSANGLSRGSNGVGGPDGMEDADPNEAENQRLVNDLKNMANIVNMVIRKTTDTIGLRTNISLQNLNTFYSIQDVVSNIFDPKTKYKWKKIQKTEGGSVKLVQVLNRWSLQKVQQTTFQNKTITTTKISSNFASQAIKSTVGRLKREFDPYIYFPEYDKNAKLRKLQTKWNGVQDYIRVPSKVFGERDKATEVQLISSLYNTLHTFAPLQNIITGVDTTLVFLDSRVIVFDVTPDYSFLVLKEDPVLYYLEHTQKRPITIPKRRRLLAEDELIYTANIIQRHCVWWDDNLYLDEQDFRGGWNTEGCSMENTTDEHSTCVCNQLGTFTILAKLQTPATLAPENDWIKIVRWALYLLSSMLILVYMTTIIVKETLHEQFHAIRFNTSLSMLGGLICVFATDFVKDDPYGCRVLSGFIQYFFLAIGCFLCVDAHALFGAIVSGVVGGRLFCYLPLAWGFPLIVLGAVIGMYPEYGIDKRCFVGPTKEMRLAFVVPIMTFGIVAFALSILTLFNTKAPVIKRKLIALELASCTKALCFVCFYFILTWIFGLVGLVDFEYPYDTMKHFYPIYSTMNSASGVFYVFPFVIGSKHFKNSLFSSGKPDLNPDNKVDPCDEYEKKISNSVVNEPTESKEIQSSVSHSITDKTTDFEIENPYFIHLSMTWSLPSLSELVDKQGSGETMESN